MSDAPLVAIVGAAGAVGREVCRLLARERNVRLRLGGRTIEPLRALHAELSRDDIEVRPVDLNDPRALAEFCEGCRVVAGCSGPSFRILDIVARAAFAAGADYVDPGGDHPVHVRLCSKPPPERRTALLTAGMMPGLSALLPRWLARRASAGTQRLTVYVGGRGRMTPGTAGDYVLSLDAGAGEPNAAWRNGARLSRALPTLTDVELPFFPGRVTAQPFLGDETERVAKALGLCDVSWYNVFDGPHMLAALRRLRHAAGPAGDLASVVSELSHAAGLDLFGRSPYQTFIITIDSEAGDRVARQTMVVRAGSAHALTGAVTMAAVVELLKGEIGPGVFYAGEVLPVTVVDWLAGMPAIADIEVFDEIDTSDAAMEEAAL